MLDLLSTELNQKQYHNFKLEPNQNTTNLLLHFLVRSTVLLHHLGFSIVQQNHQQPRRSTRHPPRAQYRPCQVNPGDFQINLVGTLRGCCNSQTHPEDLSWVQHTQANCAKYSVVPKRGHYTYCTCRTVADALTLYISMYHNRGLPSTQCTGGSWISPPGLQKGARGWIQDLVP